MFSLIAVFSCDVWFSLECAFYFAELGPALRVSGFAAPSDASATGQRYNRGQMLRAGKRRRIMAARVAVVGSVNMDLVVSTERLPNLGETILGTHFQQFGGGKGANQALAAARMGASVRLVGKVGTDEAGRTLVADLQEGGVDTSQIGRAEGPTGTAVITVDRAGTNTIIVVPAANAKLSPEDVEAARGTIADSHAVLMQLEVPMAAVLAAARIARTANVPVFLNPSPVQPLPHALLDGLSFLVVNETELEILTEGSGDAVRLFAKGVQQIVLTLGERGARLITADTSHDVPAFRVASIDTTAAGDAFLGALVATLSERGIAAALETASAAGALATTRMGAQPSLPALAEVDAFVRTERSRSSTR